VKYGWGVAPAEASVVAVMPPSSQAARERLLVRRLPPPDRADHEVSAMKSRRSWT
jgi:hypothetical protein